MGKDIERDLDEILAGTSGAREEAEQKTAANRADAVAFNELATTCMRDVVVPALNEMVRALSERKVPAQAVVAGQSATIYIPQPPAGTGDARLGVRAATYGAGDLPYLRIAPDLPNRRIRFERNSTGHGPCSGMGDVPPAEVNADVVKAKVMTFVRELYGS